MTDDMELLQEYARRNSEQAFAALVSRHINLVYSVALRQTGDAHLAEEITQTVFIILARKASSLGSKTILSGWLCRTARYASANALTMQRRRQNREQEAHMQSVLNEPESDAWIRISPLLDGALEHLGEKDHNAIVLRFFEGKDLKQIGAAMGTGEDAAKMRVHRALEKLRGYLTKRGVALPAAALTAAISSNSVQAAPVGLAASISTIAIASTAGSGVATITILKIMSMTKLKVGIITAVVAAGITIPLVIQQQTQTKLKAANESLRRETERADQLAAENEALAKGATRASTPTADSNGPSPELLKLRGEVGRLRRESTVASTPITGDQVEKRYRKAQKLARSGDSAAALKEFLWCFDGGMPRLPAFTGVRTSYLLDSIAELGKAYPAALAALRERRDQASQQILNSENDSSAAMDLAALNSTLKEEQNTLAVFDQLPAEDRRRPMLALVAYDQLVEAQRYSDALLGRSYANINMLFEMGKMELPLPANAPDAETIRKNQHDGLIDSTVKSVEALAGAGDLDHARTLAGRLLAYDSSPETKALLQQHATRAGQAGLLEGLANH